MNEPLCGREWYLQHWNDHTQAETDSLAIVITSEGMKLPAIRAGTKEKVVRDILKDIKGG